MSKCSGNYDLLVYLVITKCIPLLLYLTEVLLLGNRDLSSLDNCINRATGKMFNLHSSEDIMYVKNLYGLTHLTAVVKSGSESFYQSLHDSCMMSSLFLRLCFDYSDHWTCVN